VVSLDGPAEIHDAHRPLKDGAGSFFRACSTAKIISRSRAALCLRCCSSNRNVNDLAGIARLFCEEFDPQTIDFETVVPNETARSAGISAPDPFAFAENFIRAERVAQSMGIDAIYSAINTNGPRTSICPVGKDAVILFADGQISSCYLPEEYCLSKGRSLRVGRCRGGQVDIDMDHMRRLRAIGRSKPRCGRCFCRWTCCGGCHISVTPPGCSVEYDDFCLQTRIITAHRLIENLGAHDRAARFFGDRRSQERLTRNPSDRLDDWRGL
jgi:sulfatase maturation enzyme AslB (radical SAM superfamily)